MKYKALIVVLMLLAFLPHDVVAQGCAMCKAVAEQESQGESSISGGLNSGILYLMAIPYIIFMFAFRKRIFRFFREMRDIYHR
jgi:hypothetical protein